MTPDALRQYLCQAFCADLSVRQVPAGLAISAMFEGDDGDPVRCFLETTDAGWKLYDDGAFLADLSASGVDVMQGERSKFLTRTLGEVGAQVDPDTMQMVVLGTGAAPDPKLIVGFLSAVSRARDLAYWTRERVRSTFREDAIEALVETLQGKARIEMGGVVGGLKDFPADLVIHPNESPNMTSYTTAVFLAQSADALTEALLLRMALMERELYHIRVAAIVEEGAVQINARKSVRAINRLDGFGVFKKTDSDAAFRIVRTAIPSFAPVKLH